MVKKELKKETSEMLITVSADVKEWKEIQNNVFQDLAKKLQVSGFRKGKVPQQIAKKNISQSDIFSKSITKALDVLVKTAAKEIKNELVLDSPTYSVTKVTESQLEVQFIYPIYPDIKLSDYKNLQAKFVKEDAPKDVVDNELEKLRDKHALLVPKNGGIKKGDIANFDYEGFVDEKPFEGGEAKGHELEIGSGQFIPGFEDAMIGLKKGEKKDLNISFPKEYPSENLKGKPAVFKIKINEVKEKQRPKLNDNFAKETGIPNISTMESLRSYITEVNLEQVRQNARRKFQMSAFAEIQKDTKIIVPQGLVMKEMQGVAKNFEDQIKKQGLDMKKYMKLTGMNQEAIKSQYKNEAENRLIDSLIFAEIAKIEKIQLTDKDYEEEYKKLAKVYGNTEKGIKGVITKEQMQIPMTNDRVIDMLIKNNAGTLSKKEATKKR
ncbi:trigger factor [Candidatus Mycoplasma mahonii]|uniref:trigger factor n=1 Tax=Candidatus Mycoplasma mahonii TaxID=3004105 RepID=UPI0026EAD3A8|nr:trigger factor [Candidatus Mycoplasma mahonii]WKX02501.1 trigger factor [Candidatus Mycoplasma mahonii]